MGQLLAADSPVVAARVDEGLALVVSCARQIRRVSPHVTTNDLRSAGHEALLHAARSYDESVGVPFRRWANFRVRGAMIEVVRDSGDLPRHIYAELRAIEASDAVQETNVELDAGKPAPEGAEADSRLASYLAGMATAMAVGLLVPAVPGKAQIDDAEDGAPNPEEAALHSDLTARLRAAIEQRPADERQLLERYYFAGVTLEAAGKELGLSKSWASRLHARAIEGLAKSFVRDE